MMTLNHYKVQVEPDGTRYVTQNLDELDKNHCKDSLAKAKDGKMYANPGKNYFLSSLCTAILQNVDLITLKSKHVNHILSFVTI